MKTVVTAKLKPVSSRNSSVSGVVTTTLSDVGSPNRLIMVPQALVRSINAWLARLVSILKKIIGFIVIVHVPDPNDFFRIRILLYQSCLDSDPEYLIRIRILLYHPYLDLDPAVSALSGSGSCGIHLVRIRIRILGVVEHKKNFIDPCRCNIKY